MEGGDHGVSSKIDERIVSMKFNNDQFAKGVADTTKSLDALKTNLEAKNISSGFADLGVLIKNLPLDSLASGVQTVASKFSALGIMAIATLTNITNKAVDAGIQMARSLTIQPIMDGFNEYELKMGSIQTIMANTERYGTTLDQVTGALGQLNEYADLTIYNFGDMTKNIGLFTNAGIRIEDATSMIKGFSNAAAASGTSAQGAAGAAYQLSQALSAGTIRLMDWRSLTNVGMGNKNMQLGLIEIADAMGQLEASTITAEEIQGDFNGSLEKNWLSADVMSSYLKIMAGDMDDASMAALGLSDAQIASFKKQAATAQDAATKVRTWTQLVGTLREGVASGWSQTFDILLGDFDQATELFSGIYNGLSPMIDSMSNARNDLLKAWAEGGGRDSVINGLANAWKAGLSIFQTVKEALRDIFPPMTADTLLNISKAFENFTKKLIPGEETLDKIFIIAKGFFAVLDIGWMIIKGLVGVFVDWFGSMAPAGGGLLDLAAKIGKWLVGVRDAIKNGEGLTKTFSFLSTAGKNLSKQLQKLVGWIGDRFAIDSWAEAWEGVGKALKSVWEWMKPFFDWVGNAFATVKDKVVEAFKTMDFNILIGLLNVGALGGLGLIIKKVFDKLTGAVGGLGGGIFSSIKGVFEQLTSTMEAMQQKLKSEVLMKIAIAIGVLTAAVVALSLIDTAKLFVALGAMAVMFTQLMAAMVIMEQATSSKGYAKMPFLAAAMIGLATAMTILSAAVTIMSSMDWNELARGLVGLGGGLAIITAAALGLDKIKSSLVSAGGGLILFSTGLVVFASAMKIMSSLSWDDIGRSMVVLAGGLAAVVGAAKLMQKSAGGAVAMILIATAMTILGGALKIFATMDWDEIGRGLTVLAASLAILTGAMYLMQSAIGGAAAMIMVSSAMVILGGAFMIFSTMDWDEIARSLVVLGGGLAILTAALFLMSNPMMLLGAMAITAASAAMMLLAPALVLLGTMSWEMIGQGLTMLAASLLLLAVGGVAMIPALPGLMGLGVATALIGVGALAAGIGMAAAATAFTVFTGAVAVGAEAIKIALLIIISAIPALLAAFAQGIIDFAVIIAKGGAEFTAAMTTVLTALIDTIVNLTPKIGGMLMGLLLYLLDLLAQNVPKLVQKGSDLIIGLLNGITKEVPKIARAGVDLVISLINAIATEVPRLLEAGANAIIKLINGIATTIRNKSAELGKAGANLLSAIVEGLVNGVGTFATTLWDAAWQIGQDFIGGLLSVFGINSPSKVTHALGEWVSIGLANGIHDKADDVTAASREIGDAAIDETKESLSRISKLVDDDVMLTPTITPVIDLGMIKKGAKDIGGMFTTPVLDISKSIHYANQAQTAVKKATYSPEGFDDSGYESQGPTYIFNQTNNSPKALSPSEIYRRTNNQLSKVKQGRVTVDTSNSGAN